MVGMELRTECVSAHRPWEMAQYSQVNAQVLEGILDGELASLYRSVSNRR